jgi:signal transduction histidine kinase
VSASVPAPVRVLNVNDDAGARYVTSKVLKRAGFEVHEAETGLVAMRLAREHVPHLAVLDVRLPDVSGLEVCRALKSDPQTSGILVVQTSASFVSSANKAEGLSAGADAYLAQPFESEELLATLHSLLRGRRQEAEARERAEALTRADHRKDEFLAMLAHELRNPLSAILTAARLLQMKQGAASPRLAETIERQAHHLARLVDDLLEISRITHGKIQLKLEPVDLVDAVKRSLETAKPTFARHRNDVRLQCPEEPVLVNADPVRLEQIIGNLLTNAAKYTNDSGRVDVVVERGPGESVTVHVKDDGVGLSPEDCEHVFELFYQANTSIARSQSGLGIGLTMVERLVAMHGGRVSVKSDGPGRGTTFSVELKELVSRATSEPPTTSEGPARGTRVLFVDDNVDACELMKIWLEMAGCVVVTAHDGAEAVRIGLEHRFDVAVLDIGLPGLDGYQVASALNDSLGTLRPRLIALTGYNRPEDRSHAKRVGFDAYLAKPADPATLLGTMGDVLRGARVRLG